MRNKLPNRQGFISALLALAILAGAVLAACSPGGARVDVEITPTSNTPPLSPSAAAPTEPSAAVNAAPKEIIHEHVGSFLNLIAGHDTAGLARFIGEDTEYTGDLAAYAEHVYAYYQYYNQEGVTVRIDYDEAYAEEFSVYANIDAVSNGNRIDGRYADGKAVIIFAQIGVQQDAISIPVIDGEDMLDTVKRWADTWRQAVLALPGFSEYHVSDLVIRGVSEDADNARFPESPPAYGIGYAVKAIEPTEGSTPWIAGSGDYGTGEWDGWILNGGGIFLYEQDGYWRTGGMWTGR
ncbi:MAG: hypothetical protein LBJ99_03225 [Oscillospiraceae bacterium]|jgi:hypothetical protein|nr:hypothetical protein [Oscillospiraceae bacterium]